jgi:hypothetical protein
MTAVQLVSRRLARGKIFWPRHVSLAEVRALMSLATPIALVTKVQPPSPAALPRRQVKTPLLWSAAE